MGNIKTMKFIALGNIISLTDTFFQLLTQGHCAMFHHRKIQILLFSSTLHHLKAVAIRKLINILSIFQVPIEKFYNAHVRFEFRHCSAKDKNDKKLLGFAFLHLMDMDETTVKDGSHSLCLYKSEDVSRFENSAIYLAMPSKLSEVTSLEQV